MTTDDGLTVPDVPGDPRSGDPDDPGDLGEGGGSSGGGGDDDGAVGGPRGTTRTTAKPEPGGTTGGDAVTTTTAQPTTSTTVNRSPDLFNVSATGTCPDVDGARTITVRAKVVDPDGIRSVRLLGRQAALRPVGGDVYEISFQASRAAYRDVIRSEDNTGLHNNTTISVAACPPVPPPTTATTSPTIVLN